MTKLQEYWRLRDLYLQLEDPIRSTSIITSWGNPEFSDPTSDISIVRTEIKKRMDELAREINAAYNEGGENYERN